MCCLAAIKHKKIFRECSAIFSLYCQDIMETQLHFPYDSCKQLGLPVFICFLVIFIQLWKNRTFPTLLFMSWWNHVPAIVVYSVCLPNFLCCARITFHGCLAVNRRMKSEIQDECLFNPTSDWNFKNCFRLCSLPLDITPGVFLCCGGVAIVCLTFG